MKHDKRPRQKNRRAIAKVTAFVFTGGVLLTVSVIQDPVRSQANQSPPSQTAHWLDETGQFPLIGELVSPEYLVRMYAGSEGNVYTVCLRDGTVVESGLSGEEVAASFPGLDLSSGDDDGYLLMQVDSDL